MALALLASVFVVATCGLVYELVAGALASYLLGDSITQFSTVIGTYLFSMGIGSYLSRYVSRNPLRIFIQVELLVGLLGGLSASILFVAFAYAAFFQFFLYAIVCLIGIGVGLEIPLLMQILKSQMTFKDVVSKVLSFDYIGALLASISFPLFLLPHLGLIRTALLFGILNVLVGVLLTTTIAKRERWATALKIEGIVILVFLAVAFAFGDAIQNASEESYYPDKVIYSSTTRYQRVVLTRGGDSTKLYLNGHLQFDSRDEYRYHEALVHVGASMMPQLKRALVLGGGDGLAIRELLKYPELEQVTLVDLDPAMTTLFRRSPLLSALNARAFDSDKVRIVNADAFIWLRDTNEQFDFVVIDFPDPTSYGLGKLYTTSFYKLLTRVLSPDGVAVIQSTSPYMARQSYWCVRNTLDSVGLQTLPYHAYVPSFGEWGFVLASRERFSPKRPLLSGLRFIDDAALSSLFFFPRDMDRVTTEVNRLNNQALVHYYEKEWARYGL